MCKSLTSALAPCLQMFHGSMVGYYNSTSYYDDLAWAAAWLYKATLDPAYLTDAVNFYNEHNFGSVRSDSLRDLSIPLVLCCLLLKVAQAADARHQVHCAHTTAPKPPRHLLQLHQPLYWYTA